MPELMKISKQTKSVTPRKRYGERDKFQCLTEGCQEYTGSGIGKCTEHRKVTCSKCEARFTPGMKSIGTTLCANCRAKRRNLKREW